MNLLTMLMFSANDVVQCERLLDYIAILRNKIPTGTILLVAAPDTHQESHCKIKIAAEVGFEHVELLAVGWPAVAPTTKYEAMNYVWHQGATHAARCYQDPFLFLEPDAVPLRASWLDELTAAYYSQPRRYMGSILASADGAVKRLSRVSIYPRGAGGELKEFTAGKTPFDIAAGAMVVSRASKSKLFQQLQFDATTERSKIRDDAVLLHSDKQSVLLSALIEEATRPLEERAMTLSDFYKYSAEIIKVDAAPDEQEAKIPVTEMTPADWDKFEKDSNTDQNDQKPIFPPHQPPTSHLKTDGRATGEPVAAGEAENQNDDPEPPDRRTRVWREWKERQSLTHV